LVFSDFEGLDGTVTAVSNVELHNYGVLKLIVFKR
jgi:hypothetical protein